MHSNNISYCKKGQCCCDMLKVLSLGLLIWIFNMLLFTCISSKIYSHINILACFSLIYVLFTALGIKRYSHKKKFIISDNGILLLEKKNNEIRKYLYTWNKIQEIKYFSAHKGKSNLDSLDISLWERKYRLSRIKAETIDIDLQDYLPFKFSNYNTYNKDVDSALRYQCKKHGVHYELIH